MEQNVSDEKARVVEHVEDTGLSRLPDEVQLALADIASVAREGLLALSVTAGLAVLGEMMEAERTGLCGPRDAKDPGREFGRNGTAPTAVVLGGRKVPIRRPRVHATDGSSEPRLESFTEASSQDLLTQVAMERMLAGISTRKYKPHADGGRRGHGRGGEVLRRPERPSHQGRRAARRHDRSRGRLHLLWCSERAGALRGGLHDRCGRAAYLGAAHDLGNQERVRHQHVGPSYVRAGAATGVLNTLCEVSER